MDYRKVNFLGVHTSIPIFHLFSPPVPYTLHILIDLSSLFFKVGSLKMYYNSPKDKDQHLRFKNHNGTLL